jgi:hypothetical protein
MYVDYYFLDYYADDYGFKLNDTIGAEWYETRNSSIGYIKSPEGILK